MVRRRGLTARWFGAAALVTPFLLGAAAAPSAGEGTAICQIQEPAITEASGLVSTGSPPGGRLAVTNDSGDGGRVFFLDAGSCGTVGVTSWSEEPIDVEALAPAPSVGRQARIWVGDIGDNAANRTTIAIARIAVSRGERTVTPEWRYLTYPDGPRDAEALLRHPGTGRLFVVGKGALGGVVYAVPEDAPVDERSEMTEVGSVMGLVTDGTFWPDGKHVVLRSYTRAAVYTWPGLEEVATFPMPAQQQGEALAVTSDGRVLVTSEGTRQPVIDVPLGEEARAAVSGRPAPGQTGGGQTGDGGSGGTGGTGGAGGAASGETGGASGAGSDSGASGSDADATAAEDPGGSLLVTVIVVLLTLGVLGLVLGAVVRRFRAD